MRLRSHKGCKLQIGRYPAFTYNATGGGGKAEITQIDENTGVIHLRFNPRSFSIPTLNWRTTRFLGLPLPPGLKISIKPEKLEGIANNITGEISLEFEASFIFSIFSSLYAPSLIIKTLLKGTTEKGWLHNEEGLSIDTNGYAKLTGTAIVNPCGNVVLDRFLGLPTKAIAILSCQFTELSNK